MTVWDYWNYQSNTTIACHHLEYRLRLVSVVWGLMNSWNNSAHEYICHSPVIMFYLFYVWFSSWLQLTCLLFSELCISRINISNQTKIQKSNWKMFQMLILTTYGNMSFNTHTCACTYMHMDILRTVRSDFHRDWYAESLDKSLCKSDITCVFQGHDSLLSCPNAISPPPLCWVYKLYHTPLYSTTNAISVIRWT